MSQGRFLHTMLRVGNLDRSVDFYTRLLGMKELRRRDVPDGKYTLVFVGYAGEETGAGVIELTYNYGVEKYELGTAFGHLAVGVPNVTATCDTLRAAGVKITREPGPVKFGTTVIAVDQHRVGHMLDLFDRPGPGALLQKKNRAGCIPRGFCLGVTPEALADTLTMQRDIQPFALFFLGHAQTNDDIGDLEKDPGGNRRVSHGGGHSDDLLDELVHAARQTVWHGCCRGKRAISQEAHQ